MSRFEVDNSLENVENDSDKQYDDDDTISSNKTKNGFSRKRKNFITRAEELPAKKRRIISHEKLSRANKYKKNFSDRLFKLMYQLELSVLCSLRKIMYEHKYPLSLSFGDSENDNFSNIIIHYNKKSIYIQIENVDKHDKESYINYSRLFNKKNQSFSINNYLDSFAKRIASESDDLLKNIEYFVIYTNSGLDLTEDLKLKQGRIKNATPFQFDRITDDCDILTDFLFTNSDNNNNNCNFYQFSKNKENRKKLLKHLQFSSDIEKDKKFSRDFEKEIKKFFLKKLLFAVNQPNREELNIIIKNEIKNNKKVQHDYIKIQKNVIQNITAIEMKRKHQNGIPAVLYDFNLLMFFLHNMFLHNKLFSINFDRKNQNISYDINYLYKNKNTFIKTYTAQSNIRYSHLFTTRKQQEEIMINKYFSLFIKELKNNIKYFIIYINVSLDLTDDNTFKKEYSKEYFPVKFKSIDIQKSRYKMLKNCSFICDNGLYQFEQEEATREKLLSLLKFPAYMDIKKENEINLNEYEKEIKEKFLDKLIFAVNQSNIDDLNCIINNEIKENNNVIPYNYGELQETALRLLESREFQPITKEKMKNVFENIQNNRLSSKYDQNRNINEEIKFAKSVVGRDETLEFDKFVEYLIKEQRLKILKKNGINPANMSSILSRSGLKATVAFNDLFNLWFDQELNKTFYLKTLNKEGVNLCTMSSILSRAGAKGSTAFQALYDMWFDEDGNKTQHLTILEDEGINISNISNISHGAGANAAEAFLDLYNLWFDAAGNKKKCFKNLEKEGINLSNISNMLGGSGAKALKTFKELYDLWFDTDGNKTKYLKILEERGVNLSNMSSILGGSGIKAPKAFKELCEIWFDKEGEKSQYLNNLKEKGINISTMTSILNGAGANAAKSFKELYDVFFDDYGNKSFCLKNLEEKGINLTNVSSILDGAGANAANAFKEIYNLWFDTNGHKTQYLKSIENEGIHLSNMSSILGGAGGKAPRAFKELYDLWFDTDGNKTQYLSSLEVEGVNLSNMSNILNGVGANAAKSFKELYNLWFNSIGNKTPYLKTLEVNGIKLSNISSILSGSGVNAAKAFLKLFALWFDVEGNKTQYLKCLENEGLSLTNICSILSGSGLNAPNSFKKLYYLWFDMNGNKSKYLINLEVEGINLSNISSILHGSGMNASKAFMELYNTFVDSEGKKTQYLKHFIELENKYTNFTLHNLSGILSGAGAKTLKAFERLHSVCFDNNGKRTELLEDFYNAGFRPGNISCVLCGAGIRAASILKRLHNVCFNEEREKTNILNDFLNASFSLDELCRMLSASADSLEKFHEFCFIGETPLYLNNFLNEKDGFSLKHLATILHGARGNICSAFKDFHDCCFDKMGQKTQLLHDFHMAGFRPRDLAKILYMTGNNAASILRKFHKSCFNKKHYLSHFLEEEEFFTPKRLSKILEGVGTNVRPVFENLHSLCFDKDGNKTKLLNDIITNNYNSTKLVSNLRKASLVTANSCK